MWQNWFLKKTDESRYLVQRGSETILSFHVRQRAGIELNV